MSYEHDRIGYFNKEVYEQDGLKFRPIDLDDGAIVVVDFQHKSKLVDRRTDSNIRARLEVEKQIGANNKRRAKQKI